MTARLTYYYDFPGHWVNVAVIIKYARSAECETETLADRQNTTVPDACVGGRGVNSVILVNPCYSCSSLYNGRLRRPE